jgi:hypothetical protein
MEKEIKFDVNTLDDYKLKFNKLILKTFYIKSFEKIDTININIHRTLNRIVQLTINIDNYIDTINLDDSEDEDFYESEKTDGKYYIYKIIFKDFIKIHSINIPNYDIDTEDLTFMYDEDDTLFEETTNHEFLKYIIFKKKFLNKIKFYIVNHFYNSATELNESDFDLESYKKDYYKFILLNDKININNIIGKRSNINTNKKDMIYKPKYEIDVKLL